MELGLWLSIDGDADFAADLSAHAARAERQGWDALWLSEGDGAAGRPALAATLLASQAAASTERIRVGAHFPWPAGLHPLRLAEDLATIDVVSGGRFDWALRIGEDDDVDELGERVERVRASWEAGVSNAQGTDVPPCAPPPVQEDGPPLFVAGATSGCEALATRLDAPRVIDVALSQAPAGVEAPMLAMALQPSDLDDAHCDETSAALSAWRDAAGATRLLVRFESAALQPAAEAAERFLERIAPRLRG